MYVGRMASCASCAPLALVRYLRTFTYSSPICSAITPLLAPRQSALRFTLSVRMYVMRPLSYRCCATIMVCATVNPSLCAASCCRVLVVKGGAGILFCGFVLMSCTANFAPAHFLRKSLACSSLAKRWLSSAFTSAPSAFTKTAVTL